MGYVATERPSLRPWLAKMIEMYEQLQTTGDKENANKVKQLMEKMAAGELIVAFCGHFSAGKSSLINALLGEPLLPSSPIPTSANLVKVKAGRDYVRVFYHRDAPVEYEPPYDPELIRAQCRDGETIEWIEISRETDAIPPGVAILDTPGIDSTDDAHRLATESALHLADVVFYVMDYNHVQAELNFQFTKQLTDEGKTVYLIINQIDKHREDELPFAAFRDSAARAFRSWGVEAAGLFFLSLKAPDHPHNEWHELSACLRQLFADKDEWLVRGAEAGLKRIADRHIEQLCTRHEPLEQEMRMQLQKLGGADDEAAAMEELGRLETELAKWQTAPKRVEETFRTELEHVLQNAYLMPFETRARAEAYLQAMRPDFKVGWWFAKAKTEEERQRRFAAFYESVKAQAEAQIEWHVRQLLLRVGNEWNADRAWLGKCQQWTVEWEATLLASLVKQGADTSGAALLNYTDEVAAALKKCYRDSAFTLFAELLEQIAKQAAAQMDALSDELSRAREKVELIGRLARLKFEREERQRSFEQLIAAPGDDATLDETRLALLTAPPDFRKARHVETPKQQVAAKEQALGQKGAVAGNELEDERTGESRTPSAGGKRRSEQAADRLDEAAAYLEQADLLRRFAGPLRDKASRLRTRAFTVALFGAFSAGKSSLANALLGAPLLPSSPNPTTAAISKIAPPDKEHPHGTAIVKVKSESQIWADIQASLSQFGHQADTWEEALRLCARLAESGAEHPAQKPHVAFLAAVAAGYERMCDRFGATLSIRFEELEGYVADEAVSCFLDEVVLYADCPLTRQGVTLVDTPGVDSLNARHTGVAFHYMKHADALLFVTYYNHAFSKADREFLLQLGRVKDAFALDKMFFIINAADLAQSKEELDAVIAYMNDELARFGIRFPRLYALSSRMALAEKMGVEPSARGVLADSGLPAFEADFFRFLTEELTEVAVESAYAELERAWQTAAEYARAAGQSEAEKAAKRRALEEVKVKMRTVLADAVDAYGQHALGQEADELLYYVKQRAFFRLNDTFKEAFNPSVLRDDQGPVRRVLERCLDELLASVGFDLAQEMRATSLRVEAFLHKRLAEQFARLSSELRRLDEALALVPPESFAFAAPEFANALSDVDRGRFAKALSLYKNAKSFFERDEKRRMKEEIEAALVEPVDRYLAEQKERLISVYAKQYEDAVAALTAALTDQVDSYMDGLMAALAETADSEALSRIEAALRGLLSREDREAR
ncbi:MULTISPECIES: dynamin family protein [Geobacillus]|jgi:GTPase Era involved in 16S rRNA processing|uniref:dynamin family protein n=1 Tax=Geobacillus TaxID=129337 RepID=UPI0004245B0B|nr:MULTISPECIES: dynamin family protein [Geobacillus]ARA96869.1 dynamin [Geobacillus thermodenitrificans]MED0661582.1 dynamin [Geobacillus thermodenitrificans]OQP08610.1 dynamin [Geobacillus sp. 47C-IIb]PJW20564.1 dynamin [Geobacillus thermodenitrificans]QNU31158.1 dynamin family protein [Geobacillus sp. 47C-IIb]